MAIKNTWVQDTETVVTPTVNSGESKATVCIFFCNTNLSSSRTFSVYAKPDGAGAASDDYIILKDFALNAGETYTFSNEKFILEENEVISVIADTTNEIMATTIPVSIS